MSLLGCNFEIAYENTSSEQLKKVFFTPALKNSIRYDRGVGYFTSGWLRDAAEGMTAFAENGGKARWITSPKLEKHDWEALRRGHTARSDKILRKALQREISELMFSIEKQTLSALAWMVADGILDFKLAILPGQGDFHVKFGIFTDHFGNQIGFNGSYNDSRQGNQNYETITTYSSWKPEQNPYLELDINRFETLWHDEHPEVMVFELPQASRADIIELKEGSRPYNESSQITVSTTRKFELWPHQKQAIETWENNGRIGIISMATGSGKTITALKAAEKCPNLQLFIITVPRSNLVVQWTSELQSVTSFSDPILVHGRSKNWQEQLFNKAISITGSKYQKTVVVIGTMHSISGDRFLETIQDAGIPQNTLLIVDEVHNVGASSFQKLLLDSYKWRLGLSATPERHFDEVGNAVIESYFSGIIFEYSMAQALDDGFLTPYEYQVYPAYMTDDEFKEYQRLTWKILSLRDEDQDEGVTWQTNNLLDKDNPEVEHLLFKRARILKKCVQKTERLETILQDYPPDKCLIYCADNEQLELASDVLNTNNIIHLKYTSKISTSQRDEALNALAKDRVPVLLAIDCLDEGVDVPAVSQAVILASSTNKRQFIQRRGRVLRKSEKKEQAQLIDVIALPPPEAGADAKRMLKGELARAREMAELAKNKSEVMLSIGKLVQPYEILITELLSGES